ncbi:MAG: type III pantothenate kinase [Nitrospirae bacterium]|nr:type III pantothenate kinase [Nitrospirota bacterium]
MLLAIDIGNTNIVFGLYEDKNIVDYWRINSDQNKTADEYGILFREAIRSVSPGIKNIDNVIMSSVVPPLTTIIKRMVKRYFKLDTILVDENIKTGLTICYDNPKDVGADRIVNAVAAYSIYGGPVIIVDFGTATTFCAVSGASEYMGGVIVPGIMISLDALSQRAAKLPKVTLEPPAKVIGRSTVTSIQSGIVYGYAGLVDELVERIKNEMGQEMEGEPYVVATGGLAEMIAAQTRNIKEINPMLTLEGLRLIFEMNR